MLTALDNGRSDAEAARRLASLALLGDARPPPSRRLSGGGPATSPGYRTLKASLCAAGEREAIYAWSVRQGRLYATNYRVRYLELRPLDEPCYALREMLEVA
jgi:hypothetical protein